jgi:hypothetical protein
VSFHLATQSHDKTSMGKASQIPAHVTKTAGLREKATAILVPRLKRRLCSAASTSGKKGVMCSFESPDPIEIHLPCSPCQRRHLVQVGNKKSRVNLH